MRNDINVCVSCDNNYAKYAGVVIASTLANAAEDDELHFYILDGGMSNERKAEILTLKSIKDCNISFVPVDNDILKDYAGLKTHGYLTLPSFYRLKISELLTQIDRVIYFDCDVVVNSSLHDLFNINLGENCVGGVKDTNKTKTRKNPTYVNTGMLVFDLARIRAQNIEPEFIKWAKENFDKITLGDQDVLNGTLRGKITMISGEWNVQSSNFTNRSDYTNNPRVIHFVSYRKPWEFGSFSWHKDYYFKYLQLTPWALKEEEKDYWYKQNKIASLWGYFKYRPLWWCRPAFCRACYFSYVIPFIEKYVYSRTLYRDSHYLYKILGIKIKL